MFSRMQPIDESVRAAGDLGAADPDLDLLGYLGDVADLVESVVPECVGMSVAWFDLGVSFTLVASDVATAALDAVQYLDGGPCVEVDTGGQPFGTRMDSPLNEDRWLLFSRAAAARGVASTLTVPLLNDARTVVGTVNLYAATPDAFDGHHDAVAVIVGGHAADAVRNADLSFSTLATSQQAPARLEAERVVARAAEVLAARMDVELEDAAESLRRAAHRAGVDVEDVARMVLQSHDGGPSA
ncbi:GAF and ANTAR domain-containing protein [uncultured Nocardioides sp.]|uniref:GAF and ANTAR domain-containing protein n=1 Tax=uncultured Nocardioides sp. TaxID=198441 RepID=UPI0026183A07|nr:GAF and ANTAR domain-containing protein [uncultured Nocardioides sp.]